LRIGSANPIANCAIPKNAVTLGGGPRPKGRAG
jgi:hypothetical protein